MGFSSVPVTSKSTAEYPASSVGWKFARNALGSCVRTFSLMASREFKWSFPLKVTVPVAESRMFAERKVNSSTVTMPGER